MLGFVIEDIELRDDSAFMLFKLVGSEFALPRLRLVVYVRPGDDIPSPPLKDPKRPWRLSAWTMAVVVIAIKIFLILLM